MALVKSEDLRNRLRRAIEYIGAHVDRRPRLEELSEVAGMSKFHFLRVYSRNMGETPMLTARRLRLGKAWSMLAAGRRVDDVALATGYSSSQAFSNAFRLRYSISPSHVPTGGGILALPARIEWLTEQAMVTIPFRDDLVTAVQVFDELFTLVHKTGSPIETSQIYCVVPGATYLARGNAYRGLACVLMRYPIRGLDSSILPGGPYAVMRLISDWPEISENDALRVHNALSTIAYERIDGPLLARPVVDPYRRSPHERLWEILFPVRKCDLARADALDLNSAA